MHHSRQTAALILSVLVIGAAPADARERPGLQRHDFHREGSFERRNGDVVRSQTDQQATDNGFKRKTVLTDSQGRTATRDVDVSNDKSTGTRTRTVDGTTFSGKTYSGESVVKKTDDGYTRHDSFTNPEGRTSTRDVTVSKDGDTVSRTATRTNPQGETHTNTSTRTVEGGK